MKKNPKNIQDEWAMINYIQLKQAREEQENLAF